MKKRILSILLTLCMVLCLVPITVFAAGGAKDILPGTSAQSILKIDQSRLSFAGHEWWVIGQKTDKSNNAPIITLLAVNNDFGDVPFRTGSAVPFENARRYSEDNGYYANNPSDMSQWRKPNEYAGSTLQQKMVSLAEAIPEKEQAVIRPKDITEGITGQEVKAQKLWAFSQEDSIYLYRNSCKYAAKWWTRSSNEVYGYGSWTIHPDGRSGSALNVDYDAAVRPAMEMDLSSVLFISAAEHGKVADLTTPIAEYAGDEWKLTLHDSDRDDFTAKTVLVNGSVLEVEYKNAKVGDNEYISAVIKDADGSISRYARVVQLDGTTNGTRGRAAIDLTGIDMTGKTLCVFNEQFNGDHKTDYAGALREVKLTDEIDEQFTLTPGGRYYFDLSAMDVPGTANSNLPDSTLHYVPFTYAGTVNAYSLENEADNDTTSYEHSLFIANYNVTHTVSWDALNTAGLLFGKDYAGGGVDYTLRAPSVGSNSTGSGDSQRGVPQSNEWDTMLNKNSGYIKNWNGIYSWGQDTTRYNSSLRAVRGYDSGRRWNDDDATDSLPLVGFRPVLEILNPDTLGSDGLKVVTLDLNGGKLGGSSDAIHIIVKNGSKFTAPASGGLTRPAGDTGSYFMWLDSNGNSYAPGASVPADVTELTVQWTAPTYTVTLHANGGSVSPASVTTGADGKLASLPTPTRSSYSFNGWYTEKNGGTKVTTDTVFSANTTVYAHWTYTGGYYSPVYYTLTFETNGGDKLSPVSGSYNALIDLSKYAPKRSGYAFTGWYSERSLTNKVSGVYLTKDMTVYAGWRVTTAPQTDDSSVLGLWGISLCTSLAGCLALTTWQIRRRREEQSLQSIEK
ncbi:MAG: InlB B-repeat-containing protein [Oscillospiraceae bacterium]